MFLHSFFWKPPGFLFMVGGKTMGAIGWNGIMCAMGWNAGKGIPGNGMPGTGTGMLTASIMGIGGLMFF